MCLPWCRFYDHFCHNLITLSKLFKRKEKNTKHMLFAFHVCLPRKMPLVRALQVVPAWQPGCEKMERKWKENEDIEIE